ncbi:hypothetical protein [Pedobacter duraquae]|uniref:Uncharacterized protein n=1 Tax=Pedobacter duraquae TaxID=425511 RepID=A0A4R6IL35_9SPHI|nr:hypothetical protein [Pedobacter duraquae]TDO22656.1 hypothetical protein CLV32_1636 [Pedobacter duraquae]
MAQKIKIYTDDNSRAATLLDFYDLIDVRDCVIIGYEDVDQVPAIRRLLTDHGIEIQEILLV